MNRDGHNGAQFFIGPEVEKTPAFSKRTLFVVGKQDLAEIEKRAKENNTPHIFMGANHSFDLDPTDMTFYWDDTITALLDKGYWVTLDYPSHIHGNMRLILNKGIWQSRMFVPLLSVRIPNIENSSPNLTVKIDDIDFKATNPGVWCMHFKELTDSNRFTDWNEYESDAILSQEVAQHSVVITTHGDRTVVSADVGDATPEQVQSIIASMNNTELGLDTVAKSALKPEETPAPLEEVIKTPTDAAAAYAEGTKEDPLSAEASKKPIKPKK